ncbi:hypothetical protein NOGI109294_18140 [Nocardiopsis gilva]
MGEVPAGPYGTHMAVRRLSVSVPDEVADLVRAAAKESGQSVSSWAKDAFQEKLRAAAWRQQVEESSRELIAAYEAEHGPLSEESRQRARQFMREAGLLPDDKGPTIC